MTKNELLDRLIDVLEDNQWYIYYMWFKSNPQKDWIANTEYEKYSAVEDEINELQGQYD